MTNKTFASVVLESNIDKSLDYETPENLLSQIKEGQLVEVPLRGKLKKGYILSLKEKTHVKKVLKINRIVSDEVLSKDLFKLAIWMAKYYACSLSKILRCIIPSSIRKEIMPKYHIYITSNKTKKELLDIYLNLTKTKKSLKQAKAIEYFLKVKKGVLLTELLLNTKLSKAPIDSLVRKKILIYKKLFSDEIDILKNFEYFQTKEKVLNAQQQQTLDNISSSLEKGKFETHLIFGITSSGKTEIYLRAIKKAIELKKSAIMMVPEIALTAQTIEIFRSRFKEKIAIIHHKRSSGEKAKEWENILSGKAKIVIGARSSIFAPIKNLGLIILDEEHDSSYKQSEEMPSYNAKHLAIMRAKFSEATVILASATPSIESYYNATQKKYTLNTLSKRIGKSNLAKVKIINMKEGIKKSKSYFSNDLLEAIKQRCEKGEQTLIFLNRRGYNTSLHCLNCSYIFKCKHCDITLTYHKKDNILSCHLCGFKTHTLKNCPDCKSSEYIKYKGFGTEHIQSALHAIFPNIKTIRIDRDTTTQKNSHEILFKQFKSGKADVLIGTQMIVKGLHFPSVTLVGILNTDGALNIPDFRSSEIVFQLVTQACGRAGRAALAGEVIIQTYMPENDTIKLASKQDYLSFYESEIENRRLFGYPPFTQMAKIVLSSPDEKKAESFANLIREKLIKNLTSGYKIHPVLPSGRAKVKDVFRFQFLIRGKNMLFLSTILSKIKNEINLPNRISLFIDIDPISTFF
ncbi:MAG: Primosomal protein N' [Candidatus Anoxychlamydiales bacterium]|nr:Primosomal protein N' [Candidatus Anoxychlamydiales bacterium]